jgi:methylmalonyl-CoA/ethylmalonyl-CoA epimerase
VVDSISRAAGGFALTLDSAWDGRIVHDPLQGVRVSFLEAGDDQPSVELVEPAADDSPVAAFLKRGGGLHHVCYEVASLEAEIERSRAARAVLARPPQPAAAFGGRRICWVFSPQRLLIEYLETSL